MSTLNLDGKVALVTGSTRGIGLAIGRLFAEHGATLVLNGQTEEALEEAAGSIKTPGPRPTTVAADVADPKAVSAMLRTVFESHRALHILVNNAGVMRDSFIGMASDVDIRGTIETNLLGVLHMMRASARLMARTGGSIINVSSIIGVRGNAGQVVYAASKAGVIGATLAAAKELAQSKIRVNAIAPGYIDTDMIRSVPPAAHEKRLASIGMGRIGSAKDVAETALYLASDLSSYVTGQVIGVDGGMIV